MASYPSYYQSLETRVVPANSMVSDRSDSGRIRGRDLFVGNQVEIECHHAELTDTEKAALDTFFDTNRTLLFTWQYAGDSTVYDVLFLSPPAWEWQGVDAWKCVVKMAGAAQ